jgi:hypothetical protein
MFERMGRRLKLQSAVGDPLSFKSCECHALLLLSKCSATVGFDMRNPCIFRRVFFSLGEVEQHIETGEVLVILNGSLSLLLLKQCYLTNCFQKVAFSQFTRL